MGSEYLHPFTFNVKSLARRFKLPMFPLSPLMLVFLLFPSMGVWAMRTRLRYHLQPLWHPWKRDEEMGNLDETKEVGEGEAVPGHAITYGMAEEFRSRLQDAVNNLRKQKHLD